MNPAHVMAVLCFLVAVAFVVSDFNGMYLYRSPYMGKSTFS